MGFYVNPPSDAFQAVLKTKTYVDKSELTAYTNEVMESSRMLTCSSRPRRFGKSFAAKMLPFKHISVYEAAFYLQLHKLFNHTCMTLFFVKIYSN